MSNHGLLPIVEQPMLEATTGGELLARLRRIRREGMPGLVVRSSGLLDIGATSHEDVASALADIMLENPELGWRPSGRTNKLRLGKTSKGPGEFHHDARNGLGVQFRVQTAEIGSGKVWLASAIATRPEYYLLEEDADNHFRRGEVDPIIIAPDVYSTDVEPGDKVIFPTELAPNDLNDIAGPVWHRFDTSSAERQGMVVTVSLE
jgi:hypothetical protein